MPTHRNELKKMSYRDLQDMYRDLARRANWRIEQVGEARKYSNAYARRYDPMLFGNTIANIGTKKGMFALAKRGTKQNLISRIQAVEGFLENPYTEVKAVNKYVDELMSRTKLKDKDNLSKLFDLYREFGFDDYKDESETIIQVMAEMYNDGYDPERLIAWLDKISWETQEDHIKAMSDSWDAMQINRHILRNRTQDEIYDISIETILERRSDR